MDKINKIKKIEDLENFYINTVSFVPTKQQINCLLMLSESANKELKNYQKKILDLTNDEKKNIRDSIGNTLLSKIKVLIPTTFNINDTILVQVGNNPNTLDKVTLKNNYLYVINDRDIPFVTTSNGPNGILTNCNSNVYGMNRMNLFNKSLKSTNKLLNNYLISRNKYINEIFELFVNKLKTYSGDDINMINVVYMYNNILENVLSGKKLKDCGISVVSFCQTWMKKDSIGLPQFSVPSPHFQTKFYISNSKKLKKNCEISDDIINSYGIIMSQFTINMQKDYGIYGSGASFINLDKLYKSKLLK